jgi:hypothetical protein
VMYFNPPYAEAGSTLKRDAKTNVSNQTLVHKKYASVIDDYAKRELFIQFFTRIYAEIPGAIIAQFSKLKVLQSPYFSGFRKFFLSELKSMFVVPANTFDNVKGKFPIGFLIWNTDIKIQFEEGLADVYDSNGINQGKKKYYSYDSEKNINEWLRPTWRMKENMIAYLTCNSNDFQNSNGVFIQLNKSNETSTYYKPISQTNLIQSSVYFAVRHCIEATWLNDRDQFLFPNDGWESDKEFQNDCLAFTLFSNNIQSKFGTNHWIPFTEQEVDAREKFESNFMSKFIKGKIKSGKLSIDIFSVLLEPKVHYETPLKFSAEAIAVFNAGRELWKYYHRQPGCNVNASLYDIREHFQGRNEKGKMNNKSQDETYTTLITQLRNSLKVIAQKIEPKVYEYGFLKK